MNIIKQIQNKKLVISGMTNHSKLRTYRNLQIVPVYTTFVVDKGHENGLEYHYLLTNGQIVITNYKTNKYITVLNARPAQLMRYFTPKDNIFNSMLDCAKTFEKNKLNK